MNPPLEHVLPRFIEIGIEDQETLVAFRSWSPEDREQLMEGELNKLQRQVVQNAINRC